MSAVDKHCSPEVEQPLNRPFTPSSRVDVESVTSPIILPVSNSWVDMTSFLDDATTDAIIVLVKRKVPLKTTMEAFKKFVKDTKEVKTASPSGRHYLHYKVMTLD